MLGVEIFTWKERHKNIERRKARKNCWNIFQLKILGINLWFLKHVLVCMYTLIYINAQVSFSGGSDGKESASIAGDLGSILWSGKYPWRRKWQPTPVFLPGNSMERGTWWSIVHSIANTWTWLKWLHMFMYVLGIHVCVHVCTSLRLYMYVHVLDIYRYMCIYMCVCVCVCVFTGMYVCMNIYWRRKWQRTPVFLPGESQGRGTLVGCGLWGCTESDTTEAT